MGSMGADSQSAVKGKESVAMVFYYKRNVPVIKIFHVFSEGIISGISNLLIIKYC